MEKFPQKLYKVALFDVCNTLVNTTTITDFVRNFLLSPNYNPRFKFKKKITYFLYRLLKKFRLISEESFRRRLANLFKGYSEEEINQLAWQYYEKRLKKIFKEEVLKKLKEFQKKNYKVFLVSAGFDAYLFPLAKELKVKLVCTKLKKDSNRIYTGEIEGIDCFKKGKVIKLKKEISDYNNIDWQNSVVFSDSILDLPLLYETGRVYVVDPDVFLEKLAQKNKWKIIKTKR